MPEPNRGTAGPDFPVFWTYATDMWSRPQARHHLMTWQDRFEVDVMLVLFALWYPQPLARRQWRHLHALSHCWQHTATLRIRALRRRLHSPERHALYRAVLELELEAERREGLLLCRHARDLAEYPPAGTIDPGKRLAFLFPELPADAIHAGVGDFGQH